MRTEVKNAAVRRDVTKHPGQMYMALDSFQGNLLSPELAQNRSWFAPQQWHTMAPGLFLVNPSPPASMMWALPSARTKNRGLRATPSACGSCRAVAARS